MTGPGGHEPLGADLSAAVRLGGAMGSCFAAVDWASHPLGPPVSWPAEIRAAVAITLASRFPTVLWIGPHLHLIYNDAYIPMLSEKHPGALGAPGSEVWAEIWDVIGPMLAGVVTSGEATWSNDLLLMIVTDGRPQERYFTFTYSPILATDGSVSGVFCAVRETTDRVLGERRLRLLNHMAGSALQSQTEEEALASLLTEIEDDPADLPFAAVYLNDTAAGADVLVAVTRQAEDLIRPSAPVVHPWVPGRFIDPAGVVVDDLGGRLPDLEERFGADCPARALVVPLGEGTPESRLGALVVGLSPHLPLDDQYRGFCRLVGDQISAALLNARAHEIERRRAEALAELDTAKTAFFTNVSHELRTPLTLLLGPVGDALADREDPLSPGQRLRMETSLRNGQRLLSLVNTLLDFSAIEAGNGSARFVPTDLAADTVRLAVMFGSAVEQAGLTFKVDAPPLDQPVYVDREMWAKIVLNLLANALKFTFEGSIVVSLKEVDDGVELSVTDTGVGIAAADQAQLFERFHRVSNPRARSAEGSGIGLALVADLVAVHGGTVGVDSRPDEGSRFWVRIPFGSGHLPADQVRSHEDPASDEEPRSRPVLPWLQDRSPHADGSGGPPDADGRPGPDAPLVLVVDDNADMRDYLVRLLTPLYRVRAAADGLEALDLARTETPDLVLSDIMMPNLDGFGLIAALRDDPATTAIPVVFVSARAGSEGAVEGLEAGADDYLAKPFAAAELLARVRANLELDRSRRAREALERSQELLARAQRIARLGSWEIDLATRKMRGSDQFARLHGLDAAGVEELSVSSAVATVIDADEQARARAIFTRAVAERSPFSFEVALRRVDGGEWLAHVLGEVVTGSDGEPVKLVGSIQDITAQRRAQEQTAAATAARLTAAREHEIATQLQAALRPDVGISAEGLDVAGFYRAGAEHTIVGGDWYDVIGLSPGRTALVIGDVMGRGIPAATTMGQLRATVRAYTRIGMGPTAILQGLDALVQELGGYQIVTCICAVYDAADCSLTVANAGHLPALLARPGHPTRRIAPATGPPLGTGVPHLAEVRIALAPGDLVAIYTDGLVERPDRDLDQRIDQVAACLATSADLDLPATIGEITGALLPAHPNDDVAMLLARVNGDGPPGEHL